MIGVVTFWQEKNSVMDVPVHTYETTGTALWGTNNTTNTCKTMVGTWVRVRGTLPTYRYVSIQVQSYVELVQTQFFFPFAIIQIYHNILFSI